MISGYDIICVSTSPWQRPWGSRQQIMSRLCLHNRVLFIEYQYSIADYFRKPGLWPGVFKKRLRMIDRNLAVYTPLPILPFRYYSRAVNLCNQRFLLGQIRRLSKKLGFSNILLWVFEPTSYVLVHKVHERLSVYHCIDNFKHEKEQRSRFACIEKMEARLCRDCDIVLASSRALLDDKIKLNPKTFLMPSAVNDAFFGDRTGRASGSAFKDIPPGPRIGVVGTLDHRVDYELLASIARNKSDWRIIVIGDQKGPGAGALRAMRNIYFPGWVANDTLADYIDSCDVCLIPYRLNRFTDGISPIKFYEYCALGKPVVATDMAELRPFARRGLVTIAGRADSFIAAIEDALRNDSSDRKAARKAFAGDNRWSARVEAISDIVDTFIRSGASRTC
jgi:glycosyltransferase involved in cell wall biosynthesis